MSFDPEEILEEFVEAQLLGGREDRATAAQVREEHRAFLETRAMEERARRVELHRARALCPYPTAPVDWRTIELGLQHGIDVVRVHHSRVDFPLKMEATVQAAHRRRLPDTRDGKTHHFTVPWQKKIIDKDGRVETETVIVDCYLTVNCFEDGTPGEVFLRVSKMGDEVSGFCQAFSIGLSMALQHGAPLEVVCSKYVGMRFDPAGPTGQKGTPFATSIPDYVARYLLAKFGAKEEVAEHASGVAEVMALVEPPKVDADAPMCRECGGQTRRSGSCYACANCGSTTGCS